MNYGARAASGAGRVVPSRKASNIDQTAPARKHVFYWAAGEPEGAMSQTDQFWQYAKEAMHSVCDAKTDDDKQALLDLARTWTQAALLERQSYQSRQPG
jgi:hypothetical protein